jgi:hypothetical protein
MDIDELTMNQLGATLDAEFAKRVLPRPTPQPPTW